MSRSGTMQAMTSGDGGMEYTLQWRDHDSKLSESINRAWDEKHFLDVTLACGSRTISAHKLVLCACSPVLETLLCGTVAASAVHPHPMLYFNDIPYEDMCALVEFMYRGSMTVTKDSLQGIFNAAQTLQIRGLSQGMNESVDSPPDSSGSEPINYQHPHTHHHHHHHLEHMDHLDHSEQQQQQQQQPQHQQQQLHQGKRKRSFVDHDDEPVEAYDKAGTPSDDDVDSGKETLTASSAVAAAVLRGETPPYHLGLGSGDLNSEQQQHLATLLHLAAMQQPLHATSKVSYSSQPTSGPSPVLRSRLVWDPAHISMLESWYNNETRYPSISQSQSYANTLSLTPPTDSTGRNRGPVTVTAQNVSHWFQNRRRKDNHPEIEEKRVKKRSARMKRQSAPLDLTQQASPSPPPSSSSVAAAAADAADAGDCYDQRRPPADSDDDAGQLFIAERDGTSSDADASEPPR